MKNCRKYRLSFFAHRSVAIVLVILLSMAELGGILSFPMDGETQQAEQIPDTGSRYTQACCDHPDCNRACDCDDECGVDCKACCLSIQLRSTFGQTVHSTYISSSPFLFSQAHRTIDADVPAPELPPRA